MTAKKYVRKGSAFAFDLSEGSVPGSISANARDGMGVGALIFPPDGSMPERDAIEQLLRFGRVKSLSGKSALALAGMSDLHPNHPIPVGAVLSTPADFVVPSAIGSDINCGMRLVRFELPCALDAESLRLARASLREPLMGARRDVPLEGRHYRTLFEEGPQVFARSGLPDVGLWKRLSPGAIERAAARSPALEGFSGSAAGMPEFLLQDRLMRDPGLGTLGSGNHFFELQAIDERIDKQQCYALGLDASPHTLYGLIHTGSRDVGQFVGSTHASWARDSWRTARQRAPEGIFTLEGAQAKVYLAAQWAAARYAWLNRMVLQEMARQALSDAFGEDLDAVTIADCSHNVAMLEDSRVIHRKGACRAHAGDVCLIPGSMGDYSFVALGLGNQAALCSCSHGAGRLRARSASSRVHGISKLAFEPETVNGRRVSEEAPWNYMDVEKGVAAQAAAGIVAPVARMRPLATFKA